MNQAYLQSTYYRSFSLILLCLLFAGLMSGCKDDDDSPYVPPTGLWDHTIVVADISGIPDGVVFDKVMVNIKGACWDIVSTIEAPYIHGRAELELPATLSSEMLQQSIRANKKDICAHWPVEIASTDPDALIAKLDDILVYNGDKKVGRIYVSDWSGTGSTAGKGFLYYYYADRPFVLSGGNSSICYSNASFKSGWNACINVNTTPAREKPVTGTTTISDNTQLHWLFEAH